MGDGPILPDLLAPAGSGRGDGGEIVRRKCAAIIAPMRDVARKLGYAIAIHGSLKRDIDLIAAPWSDEAVDARDLVAALILAIREANEGVGFIDDRNDLVHLLQGHPKPHGRRCWSIQLGATYVDLSVMPRSRQ